MNSQKCYCSSFVLHFTKLSFSMNHLISDYFDEMTASIEISIKMCLSILFE